MNLSPVILSIPIYIALIAIEWTYDLIKKKKIYRLADAYANIGSGILEQVTGVFAIALSVGVYTLIYENFRLTDVPTTWPYLILLWILIDFCYYWAHRWSHGVNLFWMGHVVHHQSEDYNFSVALRQGALQKVFTFWVYLPLALIGFDPIWFVFVGALNTVYQFWIHTETIGKMGWFGILFNTPSHHRVHHGRNPKYIDKNHAGSLIIWDKMFGTFQAEEERPVYGITKPTNHWDPVSAHIQPIKDMFSDMASVKGIRNKILVALNPPGWLPRENGGMRYPPEVDNASYRKFDLRVRRSIQSYLLIQFVILLGFTAYFLFQFKTMPLEQGALFAFFLLFSLSTLGLLFEAKRWAYYLELFRQILIALGAYLLLSSWPMYSILILTLLDMIFLISNRKKFLASQNEKL